MTIHLVRHGETEYNRDGLGLGRADAQLTALGLLQVEATAERFARCPVGRVLSSPLTRASTMAREIARRHELEAEIRDELRELDVGETEGMSFAAMRECFPDFLRLWASDEGWKARMPGGESIEDLAVRLEGLAAELLRAEGPDFVVVSHNFSLRVLTCLILGLSPARFRSFELGLAGVTSLTIRGGRAYARTVNDRCHVMNLNLA